jgi:hypothetical protein
MTNKSIKQARQKLVNWSARDDNCPICHKDFRTGCNHSIGQAIAKLEKNIIEVIIDKRLNSK